MAERLTEHKTRKGVTEIVVKPCVDINIVIHKLCLFEDIMEKYGIESVELLEHIIKKGIVINSTIEDFAKEEYDKMKQDRYTWQKACELACEKIVDILGDCPVGNEDWQQNDDWCEEHCGENEKLLCWDRYFYQ